MPIPRPPCRQSITNAKDELSTGLSVLCIQTVLACASTGHAMLLFSGRWIVHTRPDFHDVLISLEQIVLYKLWVSGPI